MNRRQKRGGREMGTGTGTNTRTKNE